MSIVIKFKCTLEKNSKVDFKLVDEKINYLNSIYKFYINKMDTRHALAFNSLGILYIRTDNLQVVGEVMTNYFGPGFHNFMLEFIEEFAGLIKCDVMIEDSSGYYNHKDFLKLQDDFVEFLKNDFRNIAIDKETLPYYWRFDWLPEANDEIVTHMGKFKHNDVLNLIENGNFLDLAKRYFIWFNKEKDEYFYRNLAYFYMTCIYSWVKPRNENEVRLASDILEFTKNAYELNNNIDLPFREIEELKLHLDLRVEPLNAEDKIVLTGYKRELITYEISEHWTLLIPGYYERIVDHDENFEIFIDNDRLIKIECFPLLEGDGFSEELSENEFERIITAEHDGRKYQGKYFLDEANKLWTLSGEIISKDSKSKVLITSKKYYDYEWINQTFVNLNPIRNIYNHFKVPYYNYYISFQEDNLTINGEENIIVPYGDVDFKIHLSPTKEYQFIINLKNKECPFEACVLGISWDLLQWIEKYDLNVIDLDLLYEKKDKKIKNKKFSMPEKTSKADKITMFVFYMIFIGLSLSMLFLETWWVGLIFFTLASLYMAIAMYITYTRRLLVNKFGIVQTTKYVNARKRAFIGFDKLIKVDVTKKQIRIYSKYTLIEFKNSSKVIKELKKHIDHSLINYIE